MNIVQRYMIHLANKSYTPKDAYQLLNTARKLLSETGSVVRDTRVSRHHLEFDISVPESKSINDIVESLVAIMPLLEYEHIVEKKLPKDDAIRYASELFNDSKYWQSHEILESVWKTSRGNEKDLLNGLILVAAGLVHYQKDESNICISIMQRAMDKLQNSKGMYFGLDIDNVKDHVSQILNSLKIHHFTI
jgi:uncharacterized protein